MAYITAHLVNAADGTHAAGVVVELSLILEAGGSPTLVKRVTTDPEGRFRIDVDRSDGAAGDRYELVVQTTPYFAARGFVRNGLQVVDEVVVRLSMRDPDARYHFPITLAPNFSSVWWSS